MEANIIGARIKELRRETNLSQAKFGEILLVSQDTISLWENGKAIPNTEYVIEICKKFDVSSDYILGLKDQFHV